MQVVLVDNYDSFTHILAQYLRENEGVHLTIVKNDACQPGDLDAFDRIVISPGPGLPSTSGHILELIRSYSGRKPILGICLGLQAIYEAFGGRLRNLDRVQHGVASQIMITDLTDPMLKNMPNPFYAGRYHSWVGDGAYLPHDLKISATDSDGNIMACRHTTDPTFGFQFHPESILTPEGKKLIRNFIAYQDIPA